MKKTLKRRMSGFTLIELLVVVLVIGILAAIAVPQYFKVVEKGKFAEATHWMGSLKSVQERYLAKNGLYCTGSYTACSFDTDIGTMRYFSVTSLATSGNANNPGWTISLTRNTPVPTVYGSYKMDYDRANSASPFTCNNAQCTIDLMP